MSAAPVTLSSKPTDPCPATSLRPAVKLKQTRICRIWMRVVYRSAARALCSLLIVSNPLFGYEGLDLHAPFIQSPSAGADQSVDRAAAERLMSEGAELRKQGRDSLAKALEKYQAALRLWEAAGDAAHEGMTLGLMGQLCN